MQLMLLGKLFCESQDHCAGSLGTVDYFGNLAKGHEIDATWNMNKYIAKLVTEADPEVEYLIRLNRMNPRHSKNRPMQVTIAHSAHLKLF